MHRHILEEIGKKIRKVRRELGMTVQELADRAGVSKGLISRIENSRTIPSLPVLIAIIKGLEKDLSDFFGDIDQPNDQKKVVVIPKDELEPTTRENAVGFLYRSILDRSFGDILIQAKLLDLEPGSQRSKVETDGYEFKHILTGEVVYEIGDQIYELKAGDSIYFDGRIPHVPKNESTEPVRMLVIYIMLPSGSHL